MKKLFIFFAVLFLTAGCGANNDTKTLSCSSTNKQNGITTTTTYDFKHKNDEVKYVTITYDYTKDNTDKTKKTDGTNADTDGLDKNEDVNTHDDNISSDEVVDGVVGDTIDETVDTVTDTILDIAGIKKNYTNQMTIYDDVEGFSYEVEKDTDNEYKVIYEIDMEKISDTNLKSFNIDRNFSNIKTDYEGLGYTCK